ncbi:MAG TPA: hypothetical protein PKC09_08870 [Paracoccus sp. (in: a-proteobacteria)]|uniref:hypothetical protein n=1 Tax=uncultured Paracoccus sp. TaxID=189685 RepID=UPI00260B96F1|nr:hypothetical protein [uncultured Paracoccus sp.]HMQ41372.1 hypothetical protein [Paracoccus sp. (in: a-proteobacteria)]HMR35961.1 hypothetical protein [Paracoccus sp. (in: a-proteobacteria)]
MSKDRTGNLDADHRQIEDDLIARRYFEKLRLISATLPDVLAEMVRDRLFSQTEVEVLGSYLSAMLRSADALSMKYLVSGRVDGPLRKFLTIDVHESGYPVWSEIGQMAADAAQAADQLARTADSSQIKDDMVRQIVGDLTIPTRLQYAMSQRLYHEALAKGGLFWPQMHPQAYWLSDAGHRRRWLIHWAVYDSQLNLPVVYLMDCDDSGRRPLAEDPKRWPEVQAHLMAQSVTSLQLLTIAQGFDRDFDKLHPHRLRRILMGPIYSQQFTTQEGPIKEVLDNARAPAGEDWAVALTIEELQAERAIMESSGLFGVTERQIFKLDPLGLGGAGQGASNVERALVLPARPYQSLAEMDPAGFRNIRKYVPLPDGRVTAYR